MANNELITGWVYKKGELTRQKIDGWNLGIAAITSILITIAVVIPIADLDPTVKGKLGYWLILLSFFGITILINFLLKIFSGTVFGIYKYIFGIKEEEILFTNNKITSTNKTWVLNDNEKKLSTVKLNNARKITELNFKGIEKKTGKSETTYTIDIPVPQEEIQAAEKIIAYFNQYTSVPPIPGLKN
jgi:hypothetical protein